MSFYLETAIFNNIAPFNRLNLQFNSGEIAVLTSINGRGKTTILSYIADAFHEIRANYTRSISPNKDTSFYRLSSIIDNLNPQASSIVYLRFHVEGSTFLDYVNIRGQWSEKEYEEAILLKNKIPLSSLSEEIRLFQCAKRISQLSNPQFISGIFNKNIITYFPSYRYEKPGYLNDPYQVKLSFRKETSYVGTFANPIEVTSGLPALANWILDAVLDLANYKDMKTQLLYGNLCVILTKILSPKGYGALRFGVGPRNFGAARIQVMSAEENGDAICPTIFNLSSGESALLSLFGELLRQADNIMKGPDLEQVSGIVLIDEVDKHLHIKLQKEVLPVLFLLLPQVQFILTSHSPFLSMGLAEKASERSKIIDIETFGISKNPTTNSLYNEVYAMMAEDNSNFKRLYEELNEKVRAGSFPLIVTEGKTDIKHLKKANEQLNISASQLEFFEPSGDWGDSKLKLLLEQLSKVPNQRKIIGIFDRDVPSIIKEIEPNSEPFKSFGNNVYAFCIPVPQGREYYSNISIEFYYSDSELKREHEGRRLYFTNELVIEQSLTKRQEKTLARRADADFNEEAEKKIYDENIRDADWLHSKSKFADLVENNEQFSENFDFSNFKVIFDKINYILRDGNSNI